MTKRGVLFQGFHFTNDAGKKKDEKLITKETSLEGTDYLTMERQTDRMWLEDEDVKMDGQEDYEVDLTWLLAYAVGRNPKMHLMMDELFEQNRDTIEYCLHRPVYKKNALLFWLGLEGQEAANKFLIILETLRSSDSVTEKLYTDLIKAFRVGFRPYANCMKRLREVGDDELKTILGQEIGSCFLGPAYFSVILLLADDMGLKMNLNREGVSILYILWEMQDCFKEAAYYEADPGELLEKAHYIKGLKRNLGDVKSIQPSLNMNEKYASIYRRINQLCHIVGIDTCVAGGMNLSDEELKKILYIIGFEGEEDTKDYIYASTIVLLSKYILHCHQLQRER